MKWRDLFRHKEKEPEEDYKEIIRIAPSTIKFSITVKHHTHPEIRLFKAEEYAIEA